MMVSSSLRKAGAGAGPDATGISLCVKGDRGEEPPLLDGWTSAAPSRKVLARRISRESSDWPREMILASPHFRERCGSPPGRRHPAQEQDAPGGPVADQEHERVIGPEADGGLGPRRRSLHQH